MAGDSLRLRQCAGRDWRAELHVQRRRPADADAQRAEAARCALLQHAGEVSSNRPACGEVIMPIRRSFIGAMALAAAWLTAGAPAAAFDATKYPDFVGIWERADQGPPRF